MASAVSTARACGRTRQAARALRDQSQARVAESTASAHLMVVERRHSARRNTAAATTTSRRLPARGEIGIAVRARSAPNGTREHCATKWQARMAERAASAHLVVVGRRHGPRPNAPAATTTSHRLPARLDMASAVRAVRACGRTRQAARAERDQWQACVAERAVSAHLVVVGRQHGPRRNAPAASTTSHRLPASVEIGITVRAVRATTGRQEICVLRSRARVAERGASAHLVVVISTCDVGHDLAAPGVATHHM